MSEITFYHKLRHTCDTVHLCVDFPIGTYSEGKTVHSDVYEYTDWNDDNVQIFMVFTRGWLFKYGGKK